MDTSKSALFAKFGTRIAFDGTRPLGDFRGNVRKRNHLLAQIVSSIAAKLIQSRKRLVVYASHADYEAAISLKRWGTAEPTARAQGIRLITPELPAMLSVPRWLS